MQKWNKIGHIFQPNVGEFEWMNSHATVPTPLHLRDNIFRIYFSTRNKLNHNQVGFIEIDILRPTKILAISNEPVITTGSLGYFDCDGVYATSLVSHNSELWFYYAGWNAGMRGLFYSSIGFAASKDGGLSFNKYEEGIPVLSRSKYNKWACMAPYVLKLDAKWVMWYASGYNLYKDKDGSLKSFYDIKSATSLDGVVWKETGVSAISLNENRTNIARPSIIFEEGLFKCWFPYVSPKIGEYRIGYGESSDGGLHFDILDDNVLPISSDSSAFDSVAVTYPYVFDHNGTRYMLYNGNEFGKTGFGLAVLDGK